MKKIAAIFCLSALTTGAFAQGLVSFGNGPTTQISQGVAGSTAAIPSGVAGTYYFELLTSATGAAGSFTDTGLRGTNSAGAGRIAAFTSAIPNWAAGTAKSYEIAGWNSALGATFNPNWLTGNFGTAKGFFGVSGVAIGTAGGGSPVPAPAWQLFGGSGLTGFNLSPAGGGVVPEPSSMALAGLGAAALLIFRRRK